ncbi:MAG: universal stress protein [Rhodospirillaceae bacterium]|nr:universal stress protein [Rhodospirillaceae bacterium]
MTIKSIVVPLSGIGNSTHVVGAAMTLAQRFGADVLGYDAVPEPEIMVEQGAFGPVGASYSQLYEINAKLSVERRNLAKRIFEKGCREARISASKRASSKGASASWITTEKIEPRDIFSLARCADLVVANVPAGNASYTDYELLEQCIFVSAQTVLAVPGTAKKGLFGRSAIAWNGSVEAMRAVRGALPILQLGAGADIIQVGDAPAADAEILVTYLRKHDLKSKVLRLKDKKRKTGELILSTAVDFGCSVLVMGAYSHSPMRELVLGGVTRYMFENTTIPLIVAH